MLEIEETHDEKLLSSLSTMDKVKKQLDQLGICDPGQPGGEAPKVPTDIDQVEDHEIGKLHAQILEFHNFATYQLALAQGYKSECDIRVKYLKASLKANKIKDLDAHPVYIVAMREAQEAAQKVIMIDAFKGIMSKRMAVISRDIERRKLDWEKHRRSDSIHRARSLSPKDVQDRGWSNK